MGVTIIHKDSGGCDIKRIVGPASAASRKIFVGVVII